MAEKILGSASVMSELITDLGVMTEKRIFGKRHKNPESMADI